MNKSAYIFRELGHHLPFSIMSVALGLFLAALLHFITQVAGTPDPSVQFGELFHIFHPLHILFSATATTSMFWQKERAVLKAVLIGIAGSVGICGISDIIIPYLSGMILGVEMHLHVCILEHPLLILPFLLLGLLMGFLTPRGMEKHEGVILSHSLHVFISAAASIMYLVSFGMVNWIEYAGAILIFMVLAVIVPCCTSDIVFPLLFVRKDLTSANHSH